MFGDRVKKLRIEKGLNQKQLGEMLNISLPFMNQLERGTRQASPPIIKQLTEILECSADYLVLGTESE